ncbi:hypothetical protein J6590_005118 [Homalodisca vitripennis]|nr:hypothetical protein J6590_005118 [Homalodisca vitripennis]
MFPARQFKIFSRCYLLYKQIIPPRKITTSVCFNKRKDDVYIQRMAQRFENCQKIFPHYDYPLRMDPKYKVAIITGGETGIGLAAASDLLANEAQTVVLAGVCEGEVAVKKLNEDYGQGRACFMHMDVNDPRDFEELFYRVNLVYGGIDIVFNNAGILQDHVWEFEVDTNLYTKKCTCLSDFLVFITSGGRPTEEVMKILNASIGRVVHQIKGLCEWNTTPQTRPQKVDPSQNGGS